MRNISLESNIVSIQVEYASQLALEQTKVINLNDRLNQSTTNNDILKKTVEGNALLYNQQLNELNLKLDENTALRKTEAEKSKNELSMAQTKINNLVKQVEDLTASNNKQKSANEVLQSKVQSLDQEIIQNKATIQQQSLNLIEAEKKLLQGAADQVNEVHDWVSRAIQAEQGLEDYKLKMNHEIQELNDKITSLSTQGSLELDPLGGNPVLNEPYSVKATNKVAKITVTSLFTKSKSTSALPIPLNDLTATNADIIRIPQEENELNSEERSYYVRKVVTDMASDYVDFILGNSLVRVMQIEHPSIDELVGEEIVIRQINGQINNPEDAMNAVVIGGALEEEEDLGIIEDMGDDLQQTVYLEGPAFETSITDGAAIPITGMPITSLDGTANALNNSSSHGYIAMPTITQYLEDIINRIYEKHDSLVQQQANPHMVNNLLMMNNAGVLSDPTAEALEFLQNLRCDIEVMRGNILMATIRNIEMTQANSNINNQMTIPYVNNEGTLDQQVVMDHLPNSSIISDEFIARNMVTHLQFCINCSKAHMDINQERVRQLNKMLQERFPKFQESNHSASYEAMNLSEVPMNDLQQGFPDHTSPTQLENQHSLYSAGSIYSVTSSVSYNKPLPTDINMKALIKLQAIIRGFIHRRFVIRKRNAVEAVKQGVLAATLGTEQGDTGWYTCRGMLFYFCQTAVIYYLYAKFYFLFKFHNCFFIGRIYAAMWSNNP